jgi:hypothetical protein
MAVLQLLHFSGLNNMNIQIEARDKSPNYVNPIQHFYFINDRFLYFPGATRDEYFFIQPPNNWLLT